MRADYGDIGLVVALPVLCSDSLCGCWTRKLQAVDRLVLDAVDGDLVVAIDICPSTRSSSRSGNC